MLALRVSLLLLNLHVNKHVPYRIDFNYYYYCHHQGGTRWRSWLRHCATNRKVAARFPIYIGIFHGHNPSGQTVALGSTQPLMQISTGNISLGVGGGRGVPCVGLTTLPPLRAKRHEILEPQPPGTFRACPGLYRDGLPFTTIISTIKCLLNLKMKGLSSDIKKELPVTMDELF